MTTRRLAGNRVSRRWGVYVDTVHVGYVIGVLNAGAWRYWSRGPGHELRGNHCGYATLEAAKYGILWPFEGSQRC